MALRGSTGAIKKVRSQGKDKVDEDKQKKLVMRGEKLTTQRDGEELKEEGKKIGKGKEKEVRFDIEDKDDIEVVRKEIKVFKEEVKKEWEDLRKDIKKDRIRYMEDIEESKKCEKNREIRIRLVEEKIDELDRKMNKISELLENLGEEGRTNEGEDGRSIGGISIRSNSSWSLSQRTRMSEEDNLAVKR